MNENDLRVQRTRRLLREALIDLVTSHGYEPVTIRDITRKAQVGYKTFFRHYESKEALLKTIINETVLDFQKIILPPTTQNASELNTLTALRFAKEHAALMRVILQSSASDHLLTPFMHLGLEEGELSFSGSNVPDELVAHHFASSIISLLQWWLENDMVYPVEEMADYIDQLLIRPIKGLEQREGHKKTTGTN